jgi:hypothetical protein
MNRILCLIVLVCGCSVPVEGSEPVACPPVECAFVQGACDPATMTYRETREDAGPGCWMTTAACFPKGTPAGCEPADCYFEQGLGCEP